MKNIDDLISDLSKLSTKVQKRLVEAQQETAQKIKEDVLDNAPSKTGKYANSIKVSETEVKDGNITTAIYTDLKSEDGYFIGRMIENGTGIYALEPHIGHTKTFFDSQYQYWYVPADKVERPIGRLIEIQGTEFYIVKAQRPKPHFKPALENNKELYKSNIKKAMEEVL